MHAGTSWKTIEKDMSAIEIFKMDEFNNPAGTTYDLGKDGAFKQFRIIVGNFYQRNNEFTSTEFQYVFSLPYFN